MNIGIVTYHSSPNYGSVLQAYALQTYLAKIGHTSFFIRWSRWESSPSSSSRRTWFRLIPHKPVQKLYSQAFRRKFRLFSAEHLRSSPLFYSTLDELSANPPDANAYICGSDQIWNPRFVSPNRQPIAWLRFGHSSARRVAYAASFGRSDLDDTLRDRWRQYATALNAVGVREKEGVDLMCSLGREDAQWVPDPTLLLSSDDYARVESSTPENERKYLFSYMVRAGDDNHNVFAKCEEVVRRVRGLRLWRSASRNASTSELLAGHMPGPSKWLRRLHCAAFVITGSFHGLMFSLLFRRPFIVVLRTGAETQLNGRLESILRVAGLEHRAVADYDRELVDRISSEEVDWDSVERRLSEFRAKGQRFLQDALS